MFKLGIFPLVKYNVSKNIFPNIKLPRNAEQRSHNKASVSEYHLIEITVNRNLAAYNTV